MGYKIRDWDKYFEQDRSRQWKTLKWVPIPNKQGLGYKRIMSEKNGLEIFACWISLVQAASLCNPRGDLSKYKLSDLSHITLIEVKKLETAINYLSQTLDWIEVIDNLDISVNDLDKTVSEHGVGSSILFSSVLSNSNIPKFIVPSIEDVIAYFIENGYTKDLAEKFYKGYEVANWQDSKGNKIKNWKQKALHVWFRDDNKAPSSKQKSDHSSLYSGVSK